MNPLRNSVVWRPSRAPETRKCVLARRTAFRPGRPAVIIVTSGRGPKKKMGRWTCSPPAAGPLPALILTAVSLATLCNAATAQEVAFGASDFSSEEINRRFLLSTRRRRLDEPTRPWGALSGRRLSACQFKSIDASFTEVPPSGCSVQTLVTVGGHTWVRGIGNSHPVLDRGAYCSGNACNIEPEDGRMFEVSSNGKLVLHKLKLSGVYIGRNQRCCGCNGSPGFCKCSCSYDMSGSAIRVNGGTVHLVDVIFDNRNTGVGQLGVSSFGGTPHSSGNENVYIALSASAANVFYINMNTPPGAPGTGLVAQSACDQIAKSLCSSLFNRECASVSDSVRRLYCRSCVMGFFAPNSASNTVSPSACTETCPAGRYGDETGLTAAAQCKLCPAGRFSNQTGLTAAAQCQGQCPAGRFSNIAGLTNASQCEGQCSAGRWSDVPGLVSDADCKTCEQGTWSNLSASTSPCTNLCSQGKWSSTRGLISDNQCTLCVAGKYLETGGQVSALACRPCPLGWFNTKPGSKHCDEKCAVGRYGLVLNSTSGTIGCKNCRQGYYQPVEASITCIACALGQYNTQSGMDECDKKCAAGSYGLILNVATGESGCRHCPKGYYQPEIAKTACKECIPGFHAKLLGSISCKGCRKGHFSQVRALNVSCKECPIGFAQAEEEETSCPPCLPGEFGNTTGLTRCLKCARGQISDTLGAQNCSICRAGHKTYIIVSIVLVLFLIYPLLVRLGLSMIQCPKVGGRLWLMADLQEPCFRGRHLWFFLALTLPQIFLHVFGLPIAAGLMIWKNKAHLNDPVFRLRYGLLYKGYRPEREWWELVICMRKIAIVCIGTFETLLGVVWLRAFFAILIVFIAIVTHLIGRPFIGSETISHTNDTARTPPLHMLELLALSVCWLTFWGGLVFHLREQQPDSVASSLHSIVSVLIISANLVYNGTAMWCFARSFLRQRSLKELAQDDHAGSARQKQHAHKDDKDTFTEADARSTTNNLTRVLPVNSNILPPPPSVPPSTQPHHNTLVFDHEREVDALLNESDAYAEDRRRDLALHRQASHRQTMLRVAQRRKLKESKRMRSVPIFQHLNDASIGAIVDVMTPQTFKYGEAVVHEGDEAESFYIIVEGRCIVRRAYRDKVSNRDALKGSNGTVQETINELGPFDHFGEAALVTAMRRHLYRSGSKHNEVKVELRNATVIAAATAEEYGDGDSRVDTVQTMVLTGNSLEKLLRDGKIDMNKLMHVVTEKHELRQAESPSEDVNQAMLL